MRIKVIPSSPKMCWRCFEAAAFGKIAQNPILRLSPGAGENEPVAEGTRASEGLRLISRDVYLESRQQRFLTLATLTASHIPQMLKANWPAMVAMAAPAEAAMAVVPATAQKSGWSRAKVGMESAEPDAGR